jgi:hypothetical protein
MAKFYLINTTIIGTTKLLAGELVDDTVTNTAPIISAGGILWPAADAVVAAGAAIAMTARLKGASESSLDTIMASFADSRMQKTMQKATLVVAFGTGQLTQAGNGVAQTINIPSALASGLLPARAMPYAVLITLTTQFTGGGATAVKVDVGGTVVDALVKQFDAFGAAAAGAQYDQNAGTPPASKTMPTIMSGQQLGARFTPDAGHNLAALTAGSITIEVFYEEMP